jgi:GNAT superfamily N-acetyltransferase
MTDFPQLRPAMAADADAISQLITSYSPFAPGTPGREAFFYSISSAGILERLDDPAYRFVVADDAGAMAGVIAMRGGQHVAFFFVHQQYHGKGLGRRMWGKMLALALEGGKAGPYFVNADLLAVPFYERLGFAVSGAQTLSLGVPCVPMTSSAHALNLKGT